MGTASWFFLASVALLLQPKLTLFGCPLNLTIALVYAFGIKTAPHQPAASGSSDVLPEIRGTAFGAGIGLIEDVMTGSILGPNLLSKGLAGFVSTMVYREIFFQWESAVGGVVLAVLTLLDGLLVIWTRELFSNLYAGGPAVANLIIVQSIINIPLGLMLRPEKKISDERFGEKFAWFRRRRYI